MIDKAEFTPASVAVRTEPVQQRSAERITSLLDAAADLIDEHGIDGLTTSDVATRSGSSVGVVYRYFPNIQSLLRALASRNMDRFTSRVFVPELPADVRDAANHTIDVYVELLRHEPGFRAIGFGDVIDMRFVQPDASNNSILAKAFFELLVDNYGYERTDEIALDLEVMVEIGDALMHRAFLYERDGDPRFIDRLRRIAEDSITRHQSR